MKPDLGNLAAHGGKQGTGCSRVDIGEMMSTVARVAHHDVAGRRKKGCVCERGGERYINRERCSGG